MDLTLNLPFSNPKSHIPNRSMVGVAQVVEPQVVALVVVGSSPITHPIKYKMRAVEPARIRFIYKKLKISRNFPTQQ